MKEKPLDPRNLLPIDSEAGWSVPTILEGEDVVQPKEAGDGGDDGDMDEEEAEGDEEAQHSADDCTEFALAAWQQAVRPSALIVTPSPGSKSFVSDSMHFVNQQLFF